MTKNALGEPTNDFLTSQPKFDLVGPTVNDDIRRAVGRYGAEAVRNAVKQITKPRRGRPKLDDWRELQSVIDADAREWIEGGDPIASRTNYAVAKRFAESNPGQSAISTNQRIERKLAQKPYGREWYMLIRAEAMTRVDHSWRLNLRALEKLGELDSHPFWAELIERTKGEVADYFSKFGEMPAEPMTMNQVKVEARKVVQSPANYTNGGFGGLLSAYISAPTKGD